MEYRKNPVTGEWIAAPVSSLIEPSSLFERRSGLPDELHALSVGNDAEVDLLTLSVDDIRLFFEGYRTWIDTIRMCNPRCAVHSIIKTSGGMKDEQQPSRLFIVPDDDAFTDRTIASAAKYYKKKRTCLWCDLVKHEQREKTRIVDESDSLLACTLYCARLPYELMIIPKHHYSDFMSLPDALFDEFSSLFFSLIHRLHEMTNRARYSLHLHNIYVPDSCRHYTHWSLQIIPWMNNWAGFEIATAMYINSTSPEVCARRLRVRN